MWPSSKEQDMDDEFEWDHDDIVDLDGCADVTGDPQLDVFGYQSPRRNFTPPAPEFDWLGQYRADMADRERREARGRFAASEGGGPALGGFGRTVVAVMVWVAIIAVMAIVAGIVVA
jgi:hypothetical protein